MTDTENDYYIALGRFVDFYGLAESALQIALWRSAKTEDAIAKAVFSGTNVKTAIDYIRRISQSTRTPIPASIIDALDQLNAITTTRNNLLHWGSEQQQDGTRVVTNRFRAHTEQSLKEFPISTMLLCEMSSDLAIIVARLITHYVGRDPEEPYEEWQRSVQLACEPFLYKRPQPNKKCRTKAQASRKQQRQPKSSPG